MMPDKLHHAALIFANGDPNDGEMVRRWLDRLVTPYVIAADGGITVARYFGYTVNCVIGDMDSADPNDLVQLEAQGAQVLRHPPEKDETDLELALKWAASQGYHDLIIMGGLGGRFDQVIANVYLLILPELAGSSAMMAAGNQRIEVLRPGRHRIVGEAGDTISLIPMGGAAEGIVTDALKYPLRGETLYIGPARGISNVMLTDEAEVQFDAGLLLLIHTVGAA
jgi:thiamine pyrophosphokinase